MKEIEYRDVRDRDGWAAGPWDDEPDKLQWTDAETGLPCLIVRNQSGALCGYAGVAPGHVFYDVDYGEFDDRLTVHGGVTYTDRCTDEATEAGGVCHVVEPGEESDVWWVGFDCAHGLDVVPAFVKLYEDMGLTGFRGATYKTVDYVKAECASLAKQLAAVRCRRISSRTRS